MKQTESKRHICVAYKFNIVVCVCVCVCLLLFIAAKDMLEDELGDWKPEKFTRGKFYTMLILLRNFIVYHNINYYH